MDPREDKIIEPKPYFDSEMWLERRIKMALHIQCHIRAWFARRRAKELRDIRD